MHRIGPDTSQPLPDLRAAQVLQIDAERLAIGELGVVLPLAGEVGIGLDDVADVADQDERRPAMIDRQRPCITLGLAASVQHQHVPGPAGVAHAAGRRFHAGQILDRDLLRTLYLPRLLGLQDETAALVEVDTAEAERPIDGRAPDRAFEDVVVLVGRSSGGGRAAHAEHVAEFGQEQGVVGAFLPTLLALPPGDEGFRWRGTAGHVAWFAERIIARA
jgi:hypothetical protein